MIRTQNTTLVVIPWIADGVEVPNLWGHRSLDTGLSPIKFYMMYTEAYVRCSKSSQRSFFKPQKSLNILGTFAS